MNGQEGIGPQAGRNRGRYQNNRPSLGLELGYQHTRYGSVDIRLPYRAVSPTRTRAQPGQFRGKLVDLPMTGLYGDDPGSMQGLDGRFYGDLYLLTAGRGESFIQSVKQTQDDDDHNHRRTDNG